MHLLTIEIRNFRCFDDFSLNLEGDSLLLIAPNAGGKTSLLTAVRMALQGGRALTAADFADPSRPLEAIATVGDIPPAAHGAFANAMTFTQPPQLRVGVQAAWNPREGEIEVVHGFPDGGWSRASREARENLPVLWLPAWRDAARLLSFTGSVSLLDELVRTLDIDQALDTALTEIASAGQRLSRTPELQQMLTALRDELAALLPGVAADAYALGVDVAEPRDLLRQFELLLAHEGQPVPAVGQSGGLSQLSIFSVALKLLSVEPGALLVVDEPEQALHPHAQRALVAALHDRAGQSLIATHSANVLNRVDPRGITRLRRSAGGDTEAVRTAPIDDVEARRLTRYATAQTAEAYFARTVVLFEGISDLLAFRELAERSGIALDAAAVTLLSLDGADVFGTYLALLGPGGLDLRLLGLCDADREVRWSATLNRAGISVVDRATLNAAGMEVCDPDLEAELLAALSTAEVEQVIDADGGLAAFHAFAQQPANAELGLAQQQLRFIQKEKVRWAPLLAAALDLQSIPTPIVRTLGRL